MPYKSKEDKRKHNEAYRLANQDTPEWRANLRARALKHYYKKRGERQRLLDTMTKGQRRKFLDNEKKIRLKKSRAVKVNKAIEQQVIAIQAEKLKIEKEKAEQRQRVDKAVLTLISMRQRRAERYLQLLKAPRDRYLWAIDYYYQLIEDNDAQGHSNRYLRARAS